MTRRFSNNALAIGACLLWSTAFVGVKYGLQFARPFGFAGARFMLAGILLIPFCGGLRYYLRTIHNRLGFILLVCVFQTILLYAFFYVGMTFVPGALGAIVIGSSPMFTALIAHFMVPGDRMTRLKGLSISLAMIGIVVISISRQPWAGHGFREFLGVMLLTVSCISSALGNIIIARNNERINPLVLNSSQIFLGGFFLFCIALIVEGFPRAAFPLSFYLALVYLALLSAAAFTIWFVLLKKPDIKVSELNLWKFIIPVLGALWSWLLIRNEAPEPYAVIGMVCVAIAIILYYLVGLKKNRMIMASHPGMCRQDAQRQSARVVPPQKEV